MQMNQTTIISMLESLSSIAGGLYNSQFQDTLRATIGENGNIYTQKAQEKAVDFLITNYDVIGGFLALASCIGEITTNFILDQDNKK